MNLHEGKPWMTAGYWVCGVRHCHKFRHGKSQYCANHARRTHQYGHPQGRPITKKELKPYLKRVKEFFRKHKDHPATLQAIELLDRYIKEGAMSAPYRPQNRLYQEMRRLYDGGLTGKELLPVIGAVWLYSHEEPRALPDDRRNTYALSRAMLQCRPQVVRKVNYRKGKEQKIYQKVGANVHERLGQWIRDRIAPVYYQMTKAMEAEEKKLREERDRLWMPFVDEEEGE